VVMKRNGMDFVPLKDVQNQPPGEYMVRVEAKHTITDQDIEQWSPFQIKRNWVDRASFTGTENYGALSGWLFSKAAMIDPVMVNSFYVGVDSAVNLEKLLVTPLRELRSKIETFPKQSRAAIEEYFFEANTHGLKFDRMDLYARGFNDTEISVIKDWRDFWDTHYYLENLDLIHTLDSQGFKLFVGQGNTQLIAKEVAKDSSIIKV